MCTCGLCRHCRPVSPKTPRPKRRWKSGDVAMVSVNGGEERCTWATDCHNDNHPITSHWHLARRNTYLEDDEREVRPLVVIDPESSSDQDRLCKSLVEAMWAAGDERSAAVGVQPATMQAALRSLVSPPKPDEPTDPSVRVVADGLVWARVADVWVSNTQDPREWADLVRDDEFRFLDKGALA